MEDLKKKKKTQLSFAPGILFHPTEQQLLSFYLFNKTKQSKNPNYLSLPSSSLNPLSDFDLIQEIDSSYNHNPYDLSEIISSFSFGHGGSKKHWYFFTLNGMSSSKNSKRKTEGGFWKLKGRNRNVMDETETGAAILGIKRNFVFYKRNSSHSSDKTDWMMNEYALVDHQKDSYVVCRVFLKSDRKIMEDNPHSYEKESIAKLHKASISASYQQLDAPSISGIGEVIAHEDILVDKENEVEKLPPKGTHEADDVAINQQVSDGGLLSSMGFLQSDQVVKLSDGLIMDDDLLTNSTILEGDFIELDDLLLPLVGIDSSG